MKSPLPCGYAALTSFALVALLSTSVCAETESDIDDRFIHPDARDYPAVKNSGKNPGAFVPKGWSIIGQATGDLNNDKIKDVALVLKGTTAKFKQENKDLGEPIFDTNPRMLLLLFKSANGSYNLVERSNTIIPTADSPTMEEPFQSIAIKNGSLLISYRVFYSAGSWFASDSTYNFKWLGNHFVLIGAETSEVRRNSGEQTDRSYNFLNHKLKVTSSNMASEEEGGDGEKPKVHWMTLPKRALRPMSRFKTLYEWNVVKDFNL